MYYEMPIMLESEFKRRVQRAITNFYRDDSCFGAPTRKALPHRLLRLCQDGIHKSLDSSVLDAVIESLKNLVGNDLSSSEASLVEELEHILKDVVEGTLVVKGSTEKKEHLARLNSARDDKLRREADQLKKRLEELNSQYKKLKDEFDSKSQILAERNQYENFTKESFDESCQKIANSALQEQTFKHDSLMSELENKMREEGAEIQGLNAYLKELKSKIKEFQSQTNTPEDVRFKN